MEDDKLCGKCVEVGILCRICVGYSGFDEVCMKNIILCWVCVGYGILCER